MLLEYPWGSVQQAQHLPNPTRLVDKVDILALTETHHFPDQQLPVVPGFQCFAVARPCKLGGSVRKHSGGILVYVSTACSKTVTVWKCPVDGTRLWLKLADLGGRKPLYVCIAYAPPQNSPYADKDLFEAIA
jgi:hypothetical protein